MLAPIYDLHKKLAKLYTIRHYIGLKQFDLYVQKNVDRALNSVFSVIPFQ